MHDLIERLFHHLEDDRLTLNPTKWAAFRDDFRHLLHAIEQHFSDGHGPLMPGTVPPPTETTSANPETETAKKVPPPNENS